MPICFCQRRSVLDVRVRKLHRQISPASQVAASIATGMTHSHEAIAMKATAAERAIARSVAARVFVNRIRRCSVWCRRLRSSEVGPRIFARYCAVLLGTVRTSISMVGSTRRRFPIQQLRRQATLYDAARSWPGATLSLTVMESSKSRA